MLTLAVVVLVFASACGGRLAQTPRGDDAPFLDRSSELQVTLLTDDGGRVDWSAVHGLIAFDREAARLLLEAGADPNTRCTSVAADTTILMEVCRLGDLATAHLLLDRGADPNVRLDGTPLSCAEESGDLVLVDLLLERGAAPVTA